MTDIPHHTDDSPSFLFEAASSLGLQPAWEEWGSTFFVQTPGGKRLVSYTRTDLNSQLGAWNSQNKLATHRLLDENGFRTIPFYAGSDSAALAAFIETSQKVVAKPRSGRHDRGVRLVVPGTSEPADASMIYERYVEGTEYRYLVLQGSVIAVQRWDRPDPATWDKVCTNLAPSQWNAELAHQAESIAKLMHLGWVAVDYLVSETEGAYVLETNCMVGISSFHRPVHGEPIPVAERFLGASFPQES